MNKRYARRALVATTVATTLALNIPAAHADVILTGGLSPDGVRTCTMNLSGHSAEAATLIGKLTATAPSDSKKAFFQELIAKVERKIAPVQISHEDGYEAAMLKAGYTKSEARTVRQWKRQYGTQDTSQYTVLPADFFTSGPKEFIAEDMAMYTASRARVVSDNNNLIAQFVMYGSKPGLPLAEFDPQRRKSELYYGKNSSIDLDEHSKTEQQKLRAYLEDLSPAEKDRILSWEALTLMALGVEYHRETRENEEPSSDEPDSFIDSLRKMASDVNKDDIMAAMSPVMKEDIGDIGEAAEALNIERKNRPLYETLAEIFVVSLAYLDCGFFEHNSITAAELASLSWRREGTVPVPTDPGTSTPDDKKPTTPGNDSGEDKPADKPEQETQAGNEGTIIAVIASLAFVSAIGGLIAWAMGMIPGVPPMLPPAPMV